MQTDHAAVAALLIAAIAAVCVIKIREEISRLRADAEIGWCGVCIESRRRADLALDIIARLSPACGSPLASSAREAVHAIDDAFSREERIALELRLDAAMDDLFAHAGGGELEDAYRQELADTELARRYYDIAASRANDATGKFAAQVLHPLCARAALPLFRNKERDDYASP